LKQYSNNSKPFTKTSRPTTKGAMTVASTMSQVSVVLVGRVEERAAESVAKVVTKVIVKVAVHGDKESMLPI